MSIHKIEIIEVGEIESHPNPEATKMEITHILGWQCCIGKDQFHKGDKAIYIEPDYLCPLSHPSFVFLKKEDGKKYERIKVRKFKGALSQGLLISVPPELNDLPVGSNVIDQLGIERYEIPIPVSTRAMFCGAPSGLYVPVFDVENYQRYRNLFTEGEDIIATEKLNGSNARFTFAKDSNGEWKQFCGTHYNWVKENKDENFEKSDIWWKAFKDNPAIGDWCQKYPEKILYGEVFGHVGGYRYGSTNKIFFAGFAILDKQTWLDYDMCQLVSDPSLRWVPEVFRGGFDEEHLLKLAELDSIWPGANQIREGIVVIPSHERMDGKIGRVILKMVSNKYLLKD